MQRSQQVSVGMKRLEENRKKEKPSRIAEREKQAMETKMPPKRATKTTGKTDTPVLKE